MKQRKRRGLLISIIIILFIIILLLGAVAYLYFFMDMFKTSKQLFFEYTSQLIQSEGGFIDTQLIQYVQKKNNTSYENNGEITFDINLPNMEDEVELANNFNITFSGKSDPSNGKSEKEISLNYSDSVNFPLTYRKSNNMIGIQTQYVGNDFVAIKSEEELSGLEDINSLLKLQGLEFSSEEIQNLKTTYFDNILNVLDDSKFSTLTEDSLTGYKLTLTSEEFKNTLVQILNALKTDTNTTHKLNEILQGIGVDIQLNTDEIDDLIENINDLELNNNVEMTVYNEGGNLNRIDINVSGNMLTINKEINGQDIIYTVNLNMETIDMNAIFTAKYTGVNTDNVKESYELSLEEEYEQTETSQQTVESNNVKSLDAEKDNIELLISIIKTAKTTAGENAEQITDIDVEEELSSGANEAYTDMRLEKETDTTFSITFVSTGDKFVIDNTGTIVEESDQTTENQTASETADQTAQNQTASETADQTAQNQTASETADQTTENQTANETTEQTATNQTTTQTSTNSTENKNQYKYSITNNVQFKSGIEIEDFTEDNAVVLNDQTNEYVSNLMNAIQERMVEVNRVQMEELGVLEEENPINYLMPEFLAGNRTTTEVDEQAVNSFNEKFELYESTNTKGATVKGLLTTIQNNNEVEENSKIEEINMDGEEYEVTDQNITFLKSSINVDDAYRVEFEKDIDTGLIYRAVINKR